VGNFLGMDVREGSMGKPAPGMEMAVSSFAYFSLSALSSSSLVPRPPAILVLVLARLLTPSSLKVLRLEFREKQNLWNDRF
jgi:hypothetical protein